MADRGERIAAEGAHIGQRLLDVVLASAVLLILLPLMLLIGLAIRVESGSPILFSQLRIGRHGQPFRMFKFRKFHPWHNADGYPLTLERDGRMTAVGTVLRATKLDELPQLWNVIRGDMSIVGPRPETFAFADCFVDGFEQILSYRPGIIGPSQVIFRNESALFPPDTDPTTFYRTVIFPIKARIDLEYYHRRTLLRDIGWIGNGALAILRFRSATIGVLAKAQDVPERLSP
jgi:lipopolysaccharide/colanic/teichoic acid biosynthesis glycosyltransferase